MFGASISCILVLGRLSKGYFRVLLTPSAKEGSRCHDLSSVNVEHRRAWRLKIIGHPNWVCPKWIHTLFNGPMDFRRYALKKLFWQGSWKLTLENLRCYYRWWFQTFVVFTSIWGKWSNSTCAYLCIFWPNGWQKPNKLVVWVQLVKNCRDPKGILWSVCCPSVGDVLFLLCHWMFPMILLMVQKPGRSPPNVSSKLVVKMG